MTNKTMLEITEPDYFTFIHRAYNITGDTNKTFFQHYHPYPEIYIYISGKAKFISEGATFSLNPYDIIIVPPYTLHRPKPAVGDFFERYVINIFPSFYENMECKQYEKLFLNHNGINHKIPGHSVKRTDAVRVLEFLDECYKEPNEYTFAVASCKVAELLYVLGSINDFETFSSMDDITQAIIDYIDANFNTISDLNSISSHFNYSQNHLSYLFKKNTGITIAKFINLKRMENVEKLCEKGYSMIHSCIESGFKSYDSFAYIYKKEFGISPSEGLKNKKLFHS